MSLNKRVLLALLLSITVSLGMPAIAADQATWTVLVFLNGDNNLDSDAVGSFNEMAKVGSTSEVNFVAQLARSGAMTSRYRITKGMQPSPRNAVENLGKTNMGDGKVLKEFLKWGLEKYPAQKTLLIVWDHGQGWRIFDDSGLKTSQLTPKLQKARTLMSAHENGSSPAPLKSISYSDTFNDFLYNREMEDAIKEAIGTKKLDAIGLDACLMGMIETAYALRDCTNVMIASEELVPGSSFNYPAFCKSLVQKPSMDANSLGSEIVTSYKSRYQKDLPDTTLSAIDLRSIDQLAQSVSSLGTSLAAQLPNGKKEIDRCRSSCATYAPPTSDNQVYGIDLGYLCSVLIAKNSDSSVKESAGKCLTELKKVVLANYAGAQRQGNYGSTGLAIYFPASKKDFLSDPYREGYSRNNTNFPIEFVQQNDWAMFINKFVAQ